MTTTTTHRTESWQQDHLGYVTGVHPSVSSFMLIFCHLPQHGILPLIWKGSPVTAEVALFHELIYGKP